MHGSEGQREQELLLEQLGQGGMRSRFRYLPARRWTSRIEGRNQEFHRNFEIQCHIAEATLTAGREVRAQGAANHDGLLFSPRERQPVIDRPRRNRHAKRIGKTPGEFDGIHPPLQRGGRSGELLVVGAEGAGGFSHPDRLPQDVSSASAARKRVEISRYRRRALSARQAVARLVLASSSPYRRELLARILNEFETLAPHVDETLDKNERPRDAVLRLARAKATAVAALRPDAIIVAGDQLAEFNERPVGKPRDDTDARRLLAKLSGHALTYCTAIALLFPGDKDPVLHLDISRVNLRTLGAEEITRYVARERPLDCAGALKLETSGIALCSGIETSDPTALIGLPLISLADLLRRRRFPLS